LIIHPFAVERIRNNNNEAKIMSMITRHNFVLNNVSIISALFLFISATQTQAAFDCEFSIVNAWGGGATAQIQATNTSSEAQILQSITASFDGMQVLQSWAAVLEGNNPYTFTPYSWNNTVAPGMSVTLGMLVSGNIENPAAELGGDCGFTGNQPPVASFGECPVAMGAAILYADEFITTPTYTLCELRGTDPDGDELSYSFDWGDGSRIEAQPLVSDTYADHRYIETADYTVTLSISDGELSDQISKTITGAGSSLRPQPLTYCTMDRANRTVSCEDRGSFDPDGPEDLGFAAFADQDVIKTELEPFSFTASFEHLGDHRVRYGITDGHNVVEQKIHAMMGELEPPQNLGLDCAFSLGDQQEYGTEATLQITNNTGEVVNAWQATMDFASDTQIVYQNNATLLLGLPETGFTADAGRAIGIDDSLTVNMILQGDISVPTLGGDCQHSTNEPPLAEIGNCMNMPNAYLYANEFIVSSNYYGCDVVAEDPEGEPVTYTIDWGDGELNNQRAHGYLKSGAYNVTLAVSDGDRVSQASTTINAIGNGLAGTTLVHCAANIENLTVNCEDRGSFDPDGDLLHYAAFINNEVYATDDQPIDFSAQFEERRQYTVAYGTTDNTHVDQQTIYVDMDEVNFYGRPPGLDCEYTVYDTDWEHGAEATLTLSNNTRTDLDYWYTFLDFPEATQIVHHDSEELHISGSPTYLFTSDRDGPGLAAGESTTIKLIVQGSIKSPVFGGDCKRNGVNNPPSACISEIQPAEPGQPRTLDASCSTDPDGGALSYYWDFGDGNEDTGVVVNHEFTPGEHRVTLTVSDGELSDSTTATIVVQPEAQLACEHRISSQWNDGFTAIINVTNLSNEAINGWEVPWTYNDGTSITRIWGAQLSESDVYLASGLPWNNQIPVGGSVSFGVIGNGRGGDVAFYGDCQR